MQTDYIDLITIDELCELLMIGRTTAYNLLRSKELKAFKNSHYVEQDFFIPYEGDMAFMQRGLVKRVVSGTTRTFKIEEVDKSAQDEAAATDGGEQA